MVSVVFPPKRKDLIVIFEDIIREPYVVIPDPHKSQQLGMYTKSLEIDNLFSIYRNPRTKESVAILKNKDVHRKKSRGGSIKYIFDFPIPKKIKMP